MTTERPLFEAERKQATRQLILSLFLSCGILFGGMYLTWHLGLQANALDHQLLHAREGVEALRHEVASGKAGTP